MIIKLKPFEFDCTAYAIEQLEDIAVWSTNCVRYNAREAANAMPYFLDTSDLWIASLTFSDRSFFLRSLWDYIYSSNEHETPLGDDLAYLKQLLQSNEDEINYLKKTISQLANPIQ